MHFSRSSLGLLLRSALLPSLIFAAPYVYDHKHNLSYQGITSSPGIEQFLGIPYGVSTAGSNRFAPPQPFSPPRGHVFNATVAGHSCPQNVGIPSDPESPVKDIDEDCLNLNVARPAGRAGREGLLPVLVWIYGGGLNTGSANTADTTPDGLIRQSVEGGLPVLYVALNYRLNIFGFATSEALRGSKSLNNGLRDQRLALEWVKENIEAFGGDPNKITIFGESSGGLSVGVQVLAYGGSKPVPLHSAIMQSTALEAGMASDISFNSTAAASNFAPGSPSQDPAVISCLRSLPMETLLNVTNIFIMEESATTDGDIFLPTVDQDFLPSLASDLVSSGKFPKMPLIIGWEENDGTLFTNPTISTPANTKAFVTLYFPYLTSSTLSTLLDLYPSADFEANVAASRSAEFYRSAEIMRDILFVCPSLLFGKAMAEKYTASDERAAPPVYLFANNQTLIANFFAAYLGLTSLGVPHGSELSYLWGDISLSNVTNLSIPGYTFAPTAEDYELEKQMPRSWASFAWTDNPSLEGKGTLPDWTSAYLDVNWDRNGDVYVIAGGHQGMAGPEGQYNNNIYHEKIVERCAFLNSPAVIGQLKY